MLRNRIVNNILRHIDINKERKCLNTMVMSDIESDNLSQNLNEYINNKLEYEPVIRSITICSECHGMGWKVDNKPQIGPNFGYKLCQKCQGKGFL